MEYEVKSMNLKEKAKQLKNDVPAIYLTMKDERTPVTAKVAAFLTVAYFLSPIDLIPDFIPVIGYLDDVILLPLMIALTVKMIPEEVWKENRVKASGLWNDSKPQQWYYSIGIILIWLLIIYVIIRKIIK